MITRRSFLHASAALAGTLPLAPWLERAAWAAPGLEATIRKRLGVPASARYVLIIDQASHMDWDWNYSFEEYFSELNPDPNYTDRYGVRFILSDAVEQLLGIPKRKSKEPHYYYSICEMGYFRKFIETKASEGVEIVSLLRRIGDHLRIVGGGITSPDCLVCSGEGFLRNYLLGQLWLASVLPNVLPLKHCWIPDDFGQDPELPVAVRALGLQSIGYSRIPGTANGSWPNDTLMNQFVAEGVDFVWQASDGASEVFTHWMPGNVPGYFQGSDLASSNADPSAVKTAIENFLGHYDKSGSVTPPFSGAPSPYLYLPADDDFMLPIPDLLQCVEVWNANAGPDQVYAVEASFDDFVSLVLASKAALPSRRYNGTPYWTGFYMSRAGVKKLHYAATRTLLASEVFGLHAFGASPKAAASQAYWANVLRGWEEFAPSTHHDYVTGTASDPVVAGEQIPLLQQAHTTATGAVEAALQAVGRAAGAPGDVVLANPAGVASAGLVELPGPVPAGMRSITIDGVATAVQPSFEGGLVFTTTLPSTGYTLAALSPAAASVPSPATITADGSGTYTLRNEYMTVVVSAAADWAVTSIVDASGTPILAADAAGNDLIFYADDGNLFQFANEIQNDTSFAPEAPTATIPAPATVLEAGPVRVRLRTALDVTVGFGTQTYVREYSLVAGEPFLRMTTTGAAPSGYSIMTRFPLAQPVDAIVHGTPCHWTAVQPARFWQGPVFLATHHFLLPQASGATLAALYHHEVPAWSYDADGALIGCVLRNTPGQQRGSNGSDDDSHTLRYALRVPSGLGAPATGQPLAEALRYVMPANARTVTFGTPPVATLPRSGFVAAVNAPAVVQAAKPGDVVPNTVILRLYQPSNAPQTLDVTLGAGKPMSVKWVTALEEPIQDGPPIKLTPTGFQAPVTTALNTVQVRFKDRIGK